MSERRYFSPTQPQTLQAAVMLLYFGAGLLFLQLLIYGVFPLFWLIEVVGKAVAAFGIANERKWGYALGIGSAFLPFVRSLYYTSNPFGSFGLLELVFAIILIVVLLHPQSREYVKIWFK
ncbi:MAG TPA: hypothetical protein VM121_11395 [Acidimicrobiales bacterium]|nr:hypothetical protein [Acidimicrobiales bacterium]